MQRIFGQSRAIESLQRALRADRLHHALIFSGPSGVGKFTTAIELAKILLDPSASPNLAGEIEVDPDSAAARRIDERSHPDLHVIRKELARFSDDASLRNAKLSNIPLDVLRQHMIGGTVGQAKKYVEPAVSHTPREADCKVFIIDEAELLDATGQNAMLKTLEEPPRDTFLILVTSQSERLLPTIRSRCQHVRFERLDDEAMNAWFAQSDLELSDDDRQWILQFAEGSPGVSVLAAEYGFHHWYQQLAPMLRDLDAGRYPAELGGTLSELVDEFAKAWVKGDKNRSKDAANKDGCRHVLNLLAAHARRGLAAACERNEDPERWANAIGLIRKAERELQYNVNFKHVLDNLVAQWSQADAALAFS